MGIEAVDISKLIALSGSVGTEIRQRASWLFEPVAMSAFMAADTFAQIKAHFKDPYEAAFQRIDRTGVLEMMEALGEHYGQENPIILSHNPYLWAPEFLRVSLLKNLQGHEGAWTSSGVAIEATNLDQPLTERNGRLLPIVLYSTDHGWTTVPNFRKGLSDQLEVGLILAQPAEDHRFIFGRDGQWKLARGYKQLWKAPTA